MESNFTNKKILFFAPSFFGYEKEIKKEFEKKGAYVKFYDDRSSNSSFYKLIIRLCPKLISKKIHIYFNEIINSNENDFDFVFFIKCEAALESDLMNLRKFFNKATFILYLYDSIQNIKYFKDKMKYFDRIYSFDKLDVKENINLKFLPLFYLDDYKKIEHDYAENKYDLVFIGSAHSDRVKIINQLRKRLIAEERTFFFRVYVPSKFIFIFKFVMSRDFRELYKNNIIVLSKISTKEVSEVIKTSNVVLDIEHPKQSGLTMRTIELLGMCKKIATTNQNIVSYDFYNTQNIVVIDRLHPYISEDVFDKKYKIIDSKIYNAYSIHSWIENIFAEEGE